MKEDIGGELAEIMAKQKQEGSRGSSYSSGRPWRFAHSAETTAAQRAWAIGSSPHASGGAGSNVRG